MQRPLLTANRARTERDPPMPWRLLRLWLLMSLATLLAGLMLAPSPVRAEGRASGGVLVSPNAQDRIVLAGVPGCFTSAP